MDESFDPQSQAGIAWGPFTFWQAGWQMLGSWQQAWFNLCLPGAGGQAARQSGWPGPEAFLATFMPFVPKIEASVVPIEPEGRLAGADRAARVTLRMTLPAMPAYGGGDVLLIDAVVAQASGGAAMRLGGAEVSPGLPAQP